MHVVVWTGSVGHQKSVGVYNATMGALDWEGTRLAGYHANFSLSNTVYLHHNIKIVISSHSEFIFECIQLQFLHSALLSCAGMQICIFLLPLNSRAAMAVSSLLC